MGNNLWQDVSQKGDSQRRKKDFRGLWAVSDGLKRLTKEDKERDLGMNKIFDNPMSKSLT